MSSAAWYQIEGIEKIDSPALVIYLEGVKHNIALAIAMAGEVSRLRPHIKTHKSENITLLMMAAGITRFKCATIAEAEMLGRCGAADVLLAYQPVGPKIDRFISLIQQFPQSRFSCLVDHAELAASIAEAARKHHLVVDVFIDLNVGMNRSGVMREAALDLYHACQQMKGLQVVGLHAYDGHITETDLKLRKQQADAVFNIVAEVQQQLLAAGWKHPVIVVGGSPTFPLHVKREGVECSPGTFVFWDQSYSDAYPDMGFKPAAIVTGRVVSLVNETTLCLDLGHKSIAAENPLQRRVRFLNEPDVLFIGQSEEHLVVNILPGHGYKPGDVFYGIPFHVCPTCALYDSAVVVENERVIDDWPITARTRKISI